MRRKKGFRKFLVYALAGVMTLSNITPALAYTDSVTSVEYQTGVVGSNETTVYAELGNDYKVTIPKSLTLDGRTKTGSYSVDVEGDIAGTDVIKVVPEESFTLTSTGLTDVTASISQDKTEWSCNEILAGSKTIGNGSISANGISAGSWNGTFWFNINLEEGAGSGDSGTGEDETQHTLTLSNYDVAMGENEAVQVTAYLDGQAVNESVTWTSDNENITVENGLIETKASAEVGESATITVTADNPQNLSAMANVLSDMGLATVAMAEDKIEVELTVTVIDMEFTSGEEKISSVDLKAGGSQEVEVTIIPASVSGLVTWTTTANSGINLVKNGNKVTIKIADDMEAGNSYDVVASYGDFSKLLKINIVADHVHSYGEGIVTKPATCTEKGIKTFTCECGDSYTEEISATGHTALPAVRENEVSATCTEKGSYDNVVYCSVCNEKINSEKISTDALGHNYVDGVCTICGDKIAPEGELSNWDYTLDDTNNIVTLNYYTGADIDVIVYANYPINGKTYKTQLASNVPDATRDTNYMFNGNIFSRYIESITFSEGIDTSKVTDMSFMFDGCNSLTSLNVTSFDTSKVTDMSFMFCQCRSLTSLDLTNWDTSKVTNMNYMFEGCKSLTSLNVTSFDTSNVTDMSQMFYGCNSLTSLNVTSFDTSNVTNMNQMFEGCKSLTSLNVTSFDTSNVTEMDHMFKDCTVLMQLDLSNFDTSNVTYMSSMFQNCNSLTSLDLSSFDTSNVTEMQYMFKNCNSLTSLDLTNWDTSKVMDTREMFYECVKLTSIKVSRNKWVIKRCDTTDMFLECGCSSVTYVD